MNPTVYAIRKLYAGIDGKPHRPWGGWGDFKARLVRAGVIESTAQNVPQTWIDAFKKACGR